MCGVTSPACRVHLECRESSRAQAGTVLDLLSPALPLNLKTTRRAGPEEKRGNRTKKRKKVESLQASPGSNHSGGKESRPLRRQPVSEQWEGARPAQAVLFIQTHTDQLVSLAASFLFIPQCRSQLQSEQQRAAPIMSHSGC